MYGTEQQASATASPAGTTLTCVVHLVPVVEVRMNL